MLIGDDCASFLPTTLIKVPLTDLTGATFDGFFFSSYHPYRSLQYMIRLIGTGMECDDSV